MPVFQQLARISGDYPHIKSELKKLISKQIAIWVEIIYHGQDEHPTLVQDIRELIKDSQINVLNIQNKTLYQKVFITQEQQIQLTQLSQLDVFHQLLAQNNITGTQKDELTHAYQSILMLLQDQDKQ